MGDTRKLIEIGNLSRLDMGNVGEGKSRMHLIDVSEWQKRWPDASIGVLAERPDGYRYTPAITIDEDGILRWVIEKGETTVAGKGQAQIMAVRTEDGFCYKSRVVQTLIGCSLPEDVDPDEPDPMETWVAHAVEAAEAAQTAKTQAEGHAQEAKTQAGNAAQSANAAAKSAEAASAAANDSAQTAEDAAASKEAAEAYAEEAQRNAEKAGSAANAAETSAQTAQTEAGKAQAHANTAGNSAQNAAKSETNAAASAAEAKAAADEAGAEVEDAFGTGALYLVNVTLDGGKNKADRTYTDVTAAANAGDTIIMRMPSGKIYTYDGVVDHFTGSGLVDAHSFLGVPYYNNGSFAVERLMLLSDATVESTEELEQMRVPNPKALKLTGAVNAAYNGSTEVSVEIPEAADLFVTQIKFGTDNAWVANHTAAEIDEAARAGKACIAVFPNQQGSAYLLVQGNAESATFARLYKMPSGAYAYDTMIIDAEGKESGGNIEEIKAPSPYKLTFTGAATGEYDGSKALEIEIPEGGGAGSGSGLPESTRSNQMLVTDENNDVAWVPRTHYTEKNIANLLYQVTLEGSGNQFALTRAMDSEPVVGQTYTLIWDGKTYSSPCADVTVLWAEFEIPKALAFGDLGLAGLDDETMSGLGITNPKPGANYVFIYIPEGDDGIYGKMATLAQTANPVLSVIGVVEVAVPLDEKYLPENVRNAGRQITLTIDADNNVTSDTDFETAWGMTDAQLQAAITIKDVSNTIYSYSSTPDCVTRCAAGIGENVLKRLQFRVRKYIDLDDVYSSDNVRYIVWDGGVVNGANVSECKMKSHRSYELPIQPQNYGAPGKGVVCWNGISYTLAGETDIIDRTDYIRPFLPDFTAADAGKVLGIGAEGNLDWKSGGAYVINLSAITVDTSASPLQPSSTPTVEQGSFAGAMEAIANGRCVLCYMPADMGGMLMTYCCQLQGYADEMGVVFYVVGLNWSIFILPDNSVEIDT